MNQLLLICMLLSLGVWSCSSNEDLADLPPYMGPMLEADSIETLYSDSAVVRIRVEAPKQYEYDNGNREFPAGIFVEFYEPDGSTSSTLVADKGYYFREKDRYTAVGNVVIDGIKDQNRLQTDTLHWSPPTQRIYTRARVMITEKQDTLWGMGLEAKQDFSEYTILDPEGSTLLSEDDEQ
jgi:LPS export ABC transporter protein LptC